MALLVFGLIMVYSASVAMPDNPRLGDILVAAGAITQAQLQQGLRVQSAAAEQGHRGQRLRGVDLREGRQRDARAAVPAHHGEHGEAPWPIVVALCCTAAATITFFFYSDLAIDLATQLRKGLLP